MKEYLLKIILAAFLTSFLYSAPNQADEEPRSYDFSLTPKSDVIELKITGDEMDTGEKVYDIDLSDLRSLADKDYVIQVTQQDSNILLELDLSESKHVTQVNLTNNSLPAVQAKAQIENSILRMMLSFGGADTVFTIGIFGDSIRVVELNIDRSTLDFAQNWPLLIEADPVYSAPLRNKTRQNFWEDLKDQETWENSYYYAPYGICNPKIERFINRRTHHMFTKFIAPLLEAAYGGINKLSGDIRAYWYDNKNLGLENAVKTVLKSKITGSTSSIVKGLSLRTPIDLTKDLVVDPCIKTAESAYGSFRSLSKGDLENGSDELAETIVFFYISKFSVKGAYQVADSAGKLAVKGAENGYRVLKETAESMSNLSGPPGSPVLAYEGSTSANAIRAYLPGASTLTPKDLLRGSQKLFFASASRGDRNKPKREDFRVLNGKANGVKKGRETEQGGSKGLEEKDVEVIPGNPLFLLNKDHRYAPITVELGGQAAYTENMVRGRFLRKEPNGIYIRSDKGVPRFIHQRNIRSLRIRVVPAHIEKESWLVLDTRDRRFLAKYLGEDDWVAFFEDLNGQKLSIDKSMINHSMTQFVTGPIRPGSQVIIPGSDGYAKFARVQSIDKSGIELAGVDAYYAMDDLISCFWTYKRTFEDYLEMKASWKPLFQMEGRDPAFVSLDEVKAWVQKNYPDKIKTVADTAENALFNMKDISPNLKKMYSARIATEDQTMWDYIHSTHYGKTPFYTQYYNDLGNFNVHSRSGAMVLDRTARIKLAAKKAGIVIND